MLLFGLENDQDFEYFNTRFVGKLSSLRFRSGWTIFLPDFKNNAFEKLYTGSCTGMTLVKDRLFVTSDDNQIITMDQRFQVIQKTKHLKLDFYDIVKFNDHVVLVVEKAINAIGSYETDTFTQIGEIRFDSADKDIHHINDIWLDFLGVEPIRRAFSVRSSNSRASPAGLP